MPIRWMFGMTPSLPLAPITVSNRLAGTAMSRDTTMNLAAALAEQGHLTKALGVAEASDEGNLAKALLGAWAGELTQTGQASSGSWWLLGQFSGEATGHLVDGGQ